MEGLRGRGRGSGLSPAGDPVAATVTHAMPELPEAETIARGLRNPLTRRRIARVRVLRPDLLLEAPSAFEARLVGRRLGDVGRRGKNVVLELDDGSRLVVNLGMSGRLLYRSRGDASPAPTHPGVLLDLDEGAGTVVYDDVRRFGRLRALDADAYREWSRSLGPEPLSPTFTARELASGLARSSSPVRAWLLDQRRVAGIGNIYANEALFAARIDPRTRASAVPTPRVRSLHRAIRSVLRAAVAARGTTLRDYRTSEGVEGSYAPRLRVYGREGEACDRCRALVVRTVFGGRSAFHCPRCQPEPLP